MSTHTTSTPLRDVLITAGATRNPIDSMRFISAHSSGATGAQIAKGLLNSGAKVHFLASPEAAQRTPATATKEIFESTRDLMARMEHWLQNHPGALVIHAAAVGDYEVAPHKGKIASGQAVLHLELRPTPKILNQIRTWDSTCFLVSFKAAPPHTSAQKLQEITLKQLQRSQSDLVFGNVIGSLNERVVLTQAKRFEPFTDRASGLNALLDKCIRALSQ